MRLLFRECNTDFSFNLDMHNYVNTSKLCVCVNYKLV